MGKNIIFFSVNKMFIIFEKTITIQTKMQFNYTQWLWQQYTDNDLLSIIQGGGLDADILRAKQELSNRHEQEQEIIKL